MSGQDGFAVVASPGHVAESLAFRKRSLKQETQVDIVTVLEDWERMPLVGDLMAEVAACRTGEERFQAIVKRYSWPTVEKAIKKSGRPAVGVGACGSI